MNNERSARKFANWDYFWGAILFLLFYLQELSLAAQWPIDLDEAFGISTTVLNSTLSAIIKNVPGQASPSPLYYLIEKGWFGLWSDSPQKYWDLMVFYRLLPALSWTTACIAVYFFAIRWLRRERPDLRAGYSTFFGVAVATFLFTDQFPRYYAMNARPYALWVSLSVAHFLFLYESVRRSLSKKEWFAYGVVCVAMCLTAGVSIAQVALGFSLQLFLFYREGGWQKVRSVLRPVITIFISCFIPTAYYMSVAMDCGNQNSPLNDYFVAIEEIFTTAAHFSAEPLGAFIAIFIMFGIAAIFTPKHRSFSIWILFSFLFFLSTPVYFLLCQIKHVTVAPRHYISLVPSFVMIVMITRFAVIDWTMRAIARFFPQFTPKMRDYVFLAFLILFTVKPLIRFENSLVRDRHMWEQRYLFGVTKNPNCPMLIPHTFPEVAAVNQACRAH